MKKIILTTVAAALIVASTGPMAMASERHHVRKVDRAAVNRQFRDANDAIAWPSGTGYSGYVDGHAISAPAGR